MKTKLLICIMFTWALNYAADKYRIMQQPNADLIGTWQYKTTYSTDSETTEIENFYFFSDHSCIKLKYKVMGNNQEFCEAPTCHRWMIVSNNVVLFDEKGKQQGAYTTKGDFVNLLKGEKIILRMIKPGIVLSGDELVYVSK